MTKDWLSFFLSEGASVIPLKKNDKKPAIKWQRYTEEKLTKEEIERILQKEGSKNFGIICGEISRNLLVLDIDNAELFEKLSLGELAAKTLTVRTAHGYHIYLRINDNKINEWIGEKGVKSLVYPLKKKGSTEESKEEIRFQWSEHYVVGPGSIHPSGVRYEYLATSPKIIRKAKGIGLLEEIERRWNSYRNIREKGKKVKEPLFDFIKRYIKPEGVTDYGDHIKIRCPFHNDTTPSFAIYKSDNHWYCYGCEIGGKHAEFLMHLKGISREEAYEELGIKKKGKEVEKNYATTVRLDDGRYAEEILRDGVEQFVVYNPGNDSWEFVDEVNNGGEKIYPLPLLEDQRDSFILPDGVEEYGSLKELRKEMLEFALEEFDPVDNRELFELMVHLLLISWIAAERMYVMSERFIPIIAIRGPSETGKKRFLTISRWLTYRSLYVLKTTKVPTLFRAISPWKGTLILDEADLADSSERSEFIEFMNSRADGVPIPRFSLGTGEVEYFHSFGMSILAERSSSTDDGYESRKIVFPSDSTPSPEKYSLLPPEEWREKGIKLQRKLLLFRLRHLNGSIPSNLLIDGIKGFRVRESLLLLQSLSEEDKEIIANISSIAKKLEERIIIERSGSMEGLIINVVYNAIIDNNSSINQYRDGFEVLREYEKRNREENETYTSPLTLKSVSKSIGDVMSPSEVARRWRGLGQGVRSRGRIDGKLYAGIIQITNVKRFLKEIGKYVLDVDYDELRGKLKVQEKLAFDEAGEGEGELNKSKKEEKPTKFVNVKDLDENGNIKKEAYDDKFQEKQDKEAMERLKKEGLIGE